MTENERRAVQAQVNQTAFVLFMVVVGLLVAAVIIHGLILGGAGIFGWIFTIAGVWFIGMCFWTGR